MPPARKGSGGFRDGLLGLYALAQMARGGPIHGYFLSERIAERTEGAWRPGPSAVYPALNKLRARQLARARSVGRRRLYSITPKGRAMLDRLRAQRSSWSSRAPDLSVLWAEVWGAEDLGTFLLLRLRRSLDAVQTVLASRPSGGARDPGVRSLREDVVAELTNRLDQLRRPEIRVVPVARRTSGGRP